MTNRVVIAAVFVNRTEYVLMPLCNGRASAVMLSANVDEVSIIGERFSKRFAITGVPRVFKLRDQSFNRVAIGLIHSV